MFRPERRLGAGPVLAAVAAAWLSGCQPDLRDQPYYRAHDRSELWPDGSSARPRVDGTVARGELPADSAFSAGIVGGRVVDRMPVAVTRAILDRGRERYGIFCSPCHGLTGTGNGTVVERGFPSPPSYHIERLRQAPDGHFFDVITHGMGRMMSYAHRVPPDDRWAITAYIRALQLSRNVPVSSLDAAARRQLEEEAP